MPTILYSSSGMEEDMALSFKMSSRHFAEAAGLPPKITLSMFNLYSSIFQLFFAAFFAAFAASFASRLAFFAAFSAAFFAALSALRLN